MTRVKCYGGPMHGQFVGCDQLRFEALMKPRCHRMEWDCHPPTYDIGPPETITYMVELFHERRGTARREMKVAVVEGHQNLLQHEEWEIERDLGAHHWLPIKKPSILREFDSWFNWCAYRNDRYNSKHLIPEFRKQKMA